MGQPQKNQRPKEHFAKLSRKDILEQPAWRALSTSAQALYPWLLLEWHGPEFNNNGRLRLSVRQAAKCLGIGINRAARAFHDLQAKGFIVVTKPGRLGLHGQARGPAFEITHIALPTGERKSGRRLYKDWREGSDFPVYRGRANNPNGVNAKTKPCHQNEDRNVIKMKTFWAVFETPTSSKRRHP